MEVLAIIPARGGSQRIPRKNIKKLHGKPLIEYTIEQAKSSKLISKIVVSTDDKKIAVIAKSMGVDVPFLRPKKYSGSTSPTIDVIKHTLNYLETEQNYIPDKIIILQPTSPLRTVKVIDDSIKKLNKKISSVISVSSVTKHPFKSFWLNQGFLTPFTSDHEKKFYQKQKLPKLYYENGLVYTFWYKTIKEYDSIYGSNIKPLLIDKEFEAIDIDTKFDFFIAEMILSNWKDFNERTRID